MFNPLYLFTKDVLDGSVKRGCTYFVRNTYNRAIDPFDEHTKAYYLVSHYDDIAKANAHFNGIVKDPARFFYDWSNPEHKERLIALATQPEGSKIFSTYFYPNYKNKITTELKNKINRYMYRYTDWKPGKGDTVNVDFSIRFGALYSTLSFEGQKIEVKFDEIENLK